VFLRPRHRPMAYPFFFSVGHVEDPVFFSPETRDVLISCLGREAVFAFRGLLPPAFLPIVRRYFFKGLSHSVPSSPLPLGGLSLELEIPVFFLFFFFFCFLFLGETTPDFTVTPSIAFSFSQVPALDTIPLPILPSANSLSPLFETMRANTCRLFFRYATSR